MNIENKPKLRYSILYVNDVEKAITFYEQVFGFERKFVSPENDYGELNTGETVLSFASKALGHDNLKDGYIESSQEQKPFGFELGITTDDVAGLTQRATDHGAILVVPVVQKPWGQVLSYVRDLDGFLLEICTSMD